MISIDIICFCHLRWNFVFQRPQHLLSRFARNRRVIFIEEPVFDTTSNHMEVTTHDTNNVWIVVPHLKAGMKEAAILEAQRMLLDRLLVSMQIKKYLLWYYSPLAFRWSDHLDAELVVYDCMDELSAFKFASPQLVQQEQQLMKRADLVFTGGQSLYEAKKHLHNNIYLFPSSIDKNHFNIARSELQEPTDQATIPHPRIGYYGVLDERLDTALLQDLAVLRPDWHFILVGPVVKIDAADLPRADNIHYLGSKQYRELPYYLAGWDIAMMPFALNESTRFISPTKTPEYLAGGKQVISTPIKDVITPYEENGLVYIATTPAIFVAAAEAILTRTGYNEWLAKVDAFLSGISWEKTWHKMEELITSAMGNKQEEKFKAHNYV
ncbi:glycosyltransferase family 1 protein [Longitalea luteola]|uniref:glycosyltransferase family 1 protein n=1 Tax=Longitalea luteola TaxID=2812563 RepID=UPI001F623D43|nr:glycosyltransferase family 1 protein [Longitalea luteola]